jgi:c-di-GMP phosphodiesterase
MPDAFVARQPIFDSKLDVVGYELLFRGGGYVNEAFVADPERATATVILNALTELDLGRVVGSKTAWVNVSRDFVLGGLAHAVPSDSVGLEISETELADAEMVQALRELKHDGYRLALDDFCHRPGTDELLDLFSVIKLSLPELGRQELVARVESLRSFGGTLLAQKLGTQEDHAFCANAGVGLFQGYFFCRPAVVCTRGIAANRLSLLQVVAALNDPAVELSDVETLIARDVTLSFRLLRYVNSAFFGLRGEVRSIGQALALLGIENLRRWATLSVLASIDDKPTELTVTALVRARFCELAAEHVEIARPSELFTLGLFSVIDAMMDAPMHDVVASLPFADDMREALVQRRGERGRLLECVTALETAEYGLVPATVPHAGELYLEAIMWANGAAESLFGEDGASESASVKVSAPAALAAVATRQSKAPPSLAANAGEATAAGGWLRRAWTRCFGWMRRQPAPAVGD